MLNSPPTPYPRSGILIASLGIAAGCIVTTSLLSMVFGLVEDTLCNRRRHRTAAPACEKFFILPCVCMLGQLPMIVLYGTIRLSLARV